MKKKVLICENNLEISSLVSSTCQSCSLEVLCIDNPREIPNILSSESITLIILDSALEEPGIIDLLYMLNNLQCTIPVIILGNCDEKVLLSIKRIGELKKLYVYTISTDTFDKISFTAMLNNIDQKNQVINEETIATALEKKQFVMFYQPKMALATKKFVGAEALIRWERPNHGVIPPDLFIPITEKTGLIIPMTYWVIQEVFRQYSVWQRNGINAKLAINLSANMLTDVMLPDELAKLVKEFSINTKDICFEITEAAAMRSPDIVLEVLTRIRLYGFSLSIDDFGTGYSSLVELQRLPFTELKIDKSFITDLVHNVSNMHIVNAIINLAKNMNLNLVAEGVETKETADKLASMNCDTMQGYLVSKPLSDNEFVSWYRKNIDSKGYYINKDKI